MASFFRPPRFLMRERGATRTVIPESRSVICYRCAQSSTVSGFAESSSCPHCAGNLRLLPIDIPDGHWGSSIMTTESILIQPQAKVIANLLIASQDIRIEGAVQGMCICGGTATITSTGELKGGVRAATLIIEPGATIEGSIVEAPSLALGSVNVDAATRARPGTGPASQIEFKHFDLDQALGKNTQDQSNQPILLHQPTPHRLRVVR